MLSTFLLSHAFDAFLYYIIWQRGTPHVLLKVCGINASNVSEDMGYMCTMPLSCMNFCDFRVEIFNNCEIITANLSTVFLTAVKVHGLNWHF